MNKKMKKLGLYTMALLSMGLVGCNQDFDTEFVPQTNPQESLLQMSDVSVAVASATTIDLADFINEDEGTDKMVPIGTVSVKEGAMPANTILKAEVEFSKSPDFDDSIILDANSLDGSSEISVQASALQNAYFDNVTRNPATTDLYIRTVLYTVTGGTSEAMIGKPEENFFAERTVKFTPLNKVQIDAAYYYVGATNSWSDSDKTYKFDNGGGDPYENPIFTCTVPAPYNEDGTRADNWFKIAPESAYTSGDFWNNLVGVKDNGDTSIEGMLVGPGNVGAFNQPASDGAKKYRITINMLDFTYSITPITTEAYYVVGGVQGWSDKDKICLFTPEESKDIYSYTTKWTGAWDLKIWDSASFGDWDKAFGCSVDGDNSPSGALIGTGAQAISAPSAEFYTFTIDMKNMKYTWTKLDNQDPTKYEHISLIGAFNGWSDDYELREVTPHNWYAEFTQAESGELKFRANHDWGINWGVNLDDGLWDVSTKMNNIGSNGANNIYVPAGTYDVYLNDITNSILFLAK